MVRDGALLPAGAVGPALGSVCAALIGCVGADWVRESGKKRALWLASRSHSSQHDKLLLARSLTAFLFRPIPPDRLPPFGTDLAAAFVVGRGGVLSFEILGFLSFFLPSLCMTRLFVSQLAFDGFALRGRL